MTITLTATDPLIALDAVMPAARTLPDITTESVAQTDDAVTLPPASCTSPPPTRPEMTERMTPSGGTGSEALSVRHITNAAAEHPDRMHGRATRSDGPKRSNHAEGKRATEATS